MQTGSILLHYCAIDCRMNRNRKLIEIGCTKLVGFVSVRRVLLTNVFVGFLQFRQNAQAVFNNCTSPLVHFVVLVRISTDGVLNGFLYYFADIVDNKLILGNAEQNRVSNMYLSDFRNEIVDCRLVKATVDSVWLVRMCIALTSNQKQTRKI